MVDTLNSIYIFTKNCVTYDPFTPSVNQIEDYRADLARRTTCIALSFLSMMEPVGTAKTVFENVFLVINTTQVLISRERTTFKIIKIVLPTTLKVIFFVSAMGGFQAGITVAGGLMLLRSTYFMVDHLYNENYTGALCSLETLVDIASTSITLLYPSLIVAIASTAFNTGFYVFKAYYEYYNNEKALEAISNIALACISTHQGYTQTIEIELAS